jgi:hypothetical protein
MRRAYPSLLSVKEERRQQEDREADEDDERHDLHELPEHRDEHREELGDGRDPGDLVDDAGPVPTYEPVGEDGEDYGDQDVAPPVRAEENEQALDECDQKREAESALAQPQSGGALAMLDDVLFVHRAATLPDRSDHPGTRGDPQSAGGAFRIGEVVEEPVDGRAGAAHVCPEGAVVEQLVDEARSPRGLG